MGELTELPGASEGRAVRATGALPWPAPAPSASSASALSPSIQAPEPERLHFLGPLRFLAAAWVVWYHFGKGIVAGSDTWALTFREHGFLGVPLFFILSGYLLAHRYGAAALRDWRDVRRFWVRRFARIYPVYLLSIIMAAWYVTVARGWSPYYTKVAVLQASLLQGWQSTAACAMNCPGWSISVEAHLYLLFPFAIAVLARWPRVFVAAAALWFGLLVAAGALHLAGADLLSTRDLRFMPAAHAMSFFVGILLHRHRVALARVPAWVPLTAGVAGLAAIAWIVGPGNEQTRVLLNNAAAVPPMALIVQGTAGIRAPVADATARLMALLGDVSYGVYMLQYSIQRLLAHYLPWTGQPGASTVDGFILFAGVLLLASLVAHRILERPAQRWLVLRLARPAERRTPITDG